MVLSSGHLVVSPLRRKFISAHVARPLPRLLASSFNFTRAHPSEFLVNVQTSAHTSSTRGPRLTHAHVSFLAMVSQVQAKIDPGWQETRTWNPRGRPRGVCSLIFRRRVFDDANVSERLWEVLTKATPGRVLVKSQRVWVTEFGALWGGVGLK